MPIDMVGLWLVRQKMSHEKASNRLVGISEPGCAGWNCPSRHNRHLSSPHHCGRHNAILFNRLGCEGDLVVTHYLNLAATTLGFLAGIGAIVLTVLLIAAALP